MRAGAGYAFAAAQPGIAILAVRACCSTGACGSDPAYCSRCRPVRSHSFTERARDNHADHPVHAQYCAPVRHRPNHGGHFN